MIDLTAEEDLFELAVEQQDKSASNPTSSTSQASQAKTSTIKSIPQSNMSEPDLSEYSSLLAQETNALIRERNDAERLSHAVERHVIEDAKHLLRLFGLPYVQSPGEAEAQCAYVLQQIHSFFLISILSLYSSLIIRIKPMVRAPKTLTCGYLELDEFTKTFSVRIRILNIIQTS